MHTNKIGYCGYDTCNTTNIREYRIGLEEISFNQVSGMKPIDRKSANGSGMYIKIANSI
jgi:hypothetical protein